LGYWRFDAQLKLHRILLRVHHSDIESANLVHDQAMYVPQFHLWLTNSIIPMSISLTYAILPIRRLLCPIDTQHNHHPLLTRTPRYTPRINHRPLDAITRIILHFPILKSLRKGLLLPHLLMPRLPYILPGLDMPKPNPEMYRSPNNIIRRDLRSTRNHHSPINTRNRR
jgi:hypothetical protein